MCQKESWEAIFATEEAHSTQRGQPPRIHGPGLWGSESLQTTTGGEPTESSLLLNILLVVLDNS